MTTEAAGLNKKHRWADFEIRPKRVVKNFFDHKNKLSSLLTALEEHSLLPHHFTSF